MVYHHCLSSSQRRLSKPNRKVTLLTMSVTNGKNGKSRKTLKASEGRSDLNTLRDRAGTFESQMIKKHLVVWSEHALVVPPPAMHWVCIWPQNRQAVAMGRLHVMSHRIYIIPPVDPVARCRSATSSWPIYLPCQLSSGLVDAFHRQHAGSIRRTDTLASG